MGSRVRGQRSHTSSNIPRAAITSQSQPHTHIHIPQRTLSLPSSLLAHAHQPSGAMPCLVNPAQAQDSTGKESFPDATGLQLVHSNPDANKRCQGSLSLDHYPFIHVLATPARDNSNDKVSPSSSE